MFLTSIDPDIFFSVGQIFKIITKNWPTLSMHSYLPKCGCSIYDPFIYVFCRDSSDSDICKYCSRKCITNCIQCNKCKIWLHYKCENITKKEFIRLGKEKKSYFACKDCKVKFENFNFSEFANRMKKALKDGIKNLSYFLESEGVIDCLPDWKIKNVLSKYKSNLDIVSNEIMIKADLSDKRKTLKVPGDGNFLFHAVLFDLTKNTRFSLELRMRTLIEMVKHISFYLTEQEKTEISLISLLFDDSLKDCSTMGGYSSLWTIHALSSVIQCPIIAIYPSVNGSYIRHIF